MIDWGRVQGFEWDGGKERKSELRHAVSMPEAEQIFFNQPLRVVEDRPHSGIEPRCHALGRSDRHRRLHVTFTFRRHGTLTRVISACDMHRKERTVDGQDR